MPSEPKNTFSFLYICFFATLLIGWLTLQSTHALHPDITWLTEAARRLLSGDGMAQSFYEPNPPWTILFHIPPILLSDYGFSLHHAVFFYFTALFLLSITLFYAVLKSRGDINPTTILLLITLYGFSAALMASFYFGERDHILIFGLMPFALAQLSLTDGQPIPKKLKWFVFIFGTVLILLKPHFGLLPTVLLIHRMVKQKRIFSIIKDSDFLCLAIGTLSYLSITWLFFHDYLTTILPDVIDLYLPRHRAFIVLQTSLLYVAGAGLAIIITQKLLPHGKIKDFAIFFLIAGLICLIPYAVQTKGFIYQLTPALVFLSCGAALTVYGILKPRIKERGALWGASIGALFIIAFFFPPNTAHPTPEDYNDFEITKLVTSCKPDCQSFFIFNNETSVIHTTSFYTGLPHASRFPSFWFLPEMLLNPDQDLFDKYSTMVVEDFQRWQPGILLIAKFKIIKKDDAPFDFVSYFSQNDDFQALWNNYKKTGSLAVDRRIYFAGTPVQGKIINYDIYRLQKPQR